MMKVLSAMKRLVASKIIAVSESLQDRAVNAPLQGTEGRAKICRLIENEGIGLELGVASGYFSDVLLRFSKLRRLYSIDAWADHHDSDEYLRCVRRLRKHGPRSIVMRMFFEEAVEIFPDEFFDFIYIDGYAHTGQDGGRILEQWWPKLKNGGLFSGHDYDERWPDTVQAVDWFAMKQKKMIQVLDGVDDLGGTEHFSSWYFRK